MFARPIALIFIFLSVLAAAEAAAGPAAPTGKWRAENIDGGGVLDRVQPTLEIHDDGMVNGMGGCNRYAGSARINGDEIKFLPLLSTRMACLPVVMNQENKFHKVLEKVSAWRIDPAQQKLVLLDDKGFELIRFGRMD